MVYIASVLFISLNFSVLSHDFKPCVIFLGEYTIFYRNVHLEEKSTQSENFWPLY